MVTMKIFCRPLLCFTISAICLFGVSHSLTCKNYLEADEGAPMELHCHSEIPIDSCTFDFPGFKKIKVYAGVKNQYYEFVGNYKTGECGIRFSAMKRELEGQVTVEVTFPDEDAPATDKINVTMLHPPENCLVESNGNNFDFNEGDEMTFNCSCSKSNPLPNIISLRIGDDKPSFVSNQICKKTSKKAEISDFDKKVVCVVHHPLFGDQGFTYSRPLTIFHKPKTISESILDVGRNISLQVTVSAFPKPHAYSWTRNNGNDLILENSWLTLVKDTHCIWEVGVNVSEITKDDLEHGFELKIENLEGLYSTIVISAAKKDPNMIDDKMNVVVIITPLFLLIIVAVLILLWVQRKKIYDKLTEVKKKFQEKRATSSTNESEKWIAI